MTSVSGSKELEKRDYVGPIGGQEAPADSAQGMIRPSTTALTAAWCLE